MGNKKNKNRIALSVVGVMLVISIVVGLTYAYWTVKVNQTTTNVINTGCLSINLTDETDAIDLEDAYPISDEEAEELTPYTFKIENICNTSINYDVTLEILDQTNRLESKYIATNFNGEGKKLLTKFTSVDPTYDKDGETAVEARELVSGTLEGKSSKSYTIKLWIDQDVTDEAAMDKNFKSKVSITIFKEQGTQTLASYIKTLAKTDTTNLVYDDGTNDGNTRYIGSNPDNYLCLDSDCTSGVWRVIGVMNNTITASGKTKNLVKIVRDESIGKNAWDNSYNEEYSDYYGINDWSSATLNTYLNGDWYSANLTDNADLIESVVWNLGGYNTSAIKTSEFNSYEKGNTIYSGRATSWTGKLALMYPSDYGYATSGGSTGRSTCLTYTLWDWDSYSDCYSNDYLLDSSSWQWTLMPNSAYSNAAFDIYSTGYVSYFSVTATGEVRPSLYLVADSYILSGNGTSESPWIIGA